MLVRWMKRVPAFGSALMLEALALAALPVLIGGALAPVAASAQEAQALPARDADLTLTGTITGMDHQSYQRAPLTMPEGVDRLVVAFDYDGREEKTVIDLGLEDVNGFRGASGGNKPHFTIARSDATPSYLAGPIDAGEWALSLVVPNIRQGVTAEWTARIWFLQGAEAQMPPSPTAGRGLGWYRGDLHMHTGHSDGSCDSEAGRRVPCPLFRTVEAAKARNLDFIAITEHNTTSHAGALYEVQQYFDHTLLIPGREITTFFGHFNIFGITSPIDFRITKGGVIGFDTIADRVHELGGIVSINHPGLPSGELCMGCGWTMDNADYAKADAVELVNGSSLASADRNPEGIVSAIPFWTKLQSEGFALTPLGGSDNHDPDAHDLGAVGAPVTFIEAQDLTPQALFDGIRKGRSFIAIDPSARPLHLDFSAAGGGKSARMGGDLQLARALVRLMPDVQAPAGSVVEFHDGGTPIAELPIADAPSGVDVSLDAGTHHVHLRIRSGSGDLLAIGNAIRIDVARDE